MERAALWRAGGWAAIVAGVLLAVDAAARALAPADTMVPGRLAGLPPELWQLPGMAAAVLALFGVIVIYARQADRAGRPGFAGFVLLVVGLTVGVVYTTVYFGLFVPWIAQQIPADVEALLAAPPSAGMILRGVLVQGWRPKALSAANQRDGGATMFGLGGKLTPADRTARAVAGVGLVLTGVLLGVFAAPSAWVTALVICVGVILVVEAALNYCPAARVWSWNRPRSTPAPPDS